MNPWYKNNITVAIIVLAVLIVGGLIFFNRGDDAEGALENADVTIITEGEIEVLGVIDCLPYRTSSADQDCVKGIKGDDGKVYALNSVAIRGIEISMDEGTRVRAVGQYQAADTSSSESSAFSYDGVLVLRTLVER